MNTVAAAQSNLALVTLFVQVLMALAFLGGGGMFLVKMGRMMGIFEQNSIQHAAQLKEIKGDVKALSVVLTTVAVQKEELLALRRDLTRAQDNIADLRHGRGYVLRDQPTAPEGKRFIED